MTATPLLIASKDPRYNRKLKQALEETPIGKRLQITAWNGLEPLCGILPDKSVQSRTICLGHFDSGLLSAKTVSGGTDDNRVFMHCIPFVSQSDSSDGSGPEIDLVWPAGTAAVSRLLEQFLPAFIQNGEHPSPPDRAPATVLSTRDNCNAYLDFRGPDRNWLLRKMKSELESGRQVYYLPLMPSYRMRLSALPDSCGPGLSELLLTIHQNCSPEPVQLGQFMQMHPAGFMQFRPPDRADDIVCCDPEILRQLVFLLRTRIESQKGDAIAWIDCDGLPMSTVVRIAVLCDHVALQLPCHPDYASREARKEIALLLARLPTSCSIREIAEDEDA